MLVPQVRSSISQKRLSQNVQPLPWDDYLSADVFTSFVTRCYPAQVHLCELFARHTSMTLILLYLVYSQVSTVVRVAV